MSGTSANAALWQNADVYIADASTSGPVTVAESWPLAWAPVGLLDGEAGFAEGRKDDSNEIYAWGGLLVKKTRTKHKRTIKFTCLENNATVFGLLNPSSTRTLASGVTSSTVKVASLTEFAIGFESRDGDKVKRRYVKRAVVEEVGEVKESESGLTMYEITVAIYPETDGTLYTEIEESI